MNLKETMYFNKNESLEQLKQGNKDILKGLPPVLILQLGIAMKEELCDRKESSLTDSNKVGKAILNRMADTDIKERLIKVIDLEEKNS